MFSSKIIKNCTLIEKLYKNLFRFKYKVILKYFFQGSFSIAVAAKNKKDDTKYCLKMIVPEKGSVI